MGCASRPRVSSTGLLQVVGRPALHLRLESSCFSTHLASGLAPPGTTWWCQPWLNTTCVGGRWTLRALPLETQHCNKSCATGLEGDPLDLRFYPSLASPAHSGDIRKTAHCGGDKKTKKQKTKNLYKSLIAPLNGRIVVTGISPSY